MRKDEQSKNPPRLPGECKPIPQVKVDIRDTDGQTHWTVETHTIADLDLDGHGSPVVLVPPDRQNLNQYSLWWRLFIKRKNCGHELGIIVGMEEPILEPGTSNGLRNFSVVESVPMDLSDGGQGVGVTTYMFDGECYVGKRTEYR